VGLYRELTQDNAGLYEEVYNRTQARLRRELHLRGQESAAILLHRYDGNPNKDEPPRRRTSHRMFTCAVWSTGAQR
jgi:hypothetical protein